MQYPLDLSILLFTFQTAMDQLHMHFTSAIHNTAFNIVVGYVELVSGSQDTNFQKMHYRDLCTVSIIPNMVNFFWRGGAIHNTAFNIVVGYVELVSGSQDTNFQKMHYRDLCTVSIHS